MEDTKGKTDEQIERTVQGAKDTVNKSSSDRLQKPGGGGLARQVHVEAVRGSCPILERIILNSPTIARRPVPSSRPAQHQLHVYAFY